MRLYNSHSCTPVASTSGFMQPREKIIITRLPDDSHEETKFGGRRPLQQLNRRTSRVLSGSKNSPRKTIVSSTRRPSSSYRDGLENQSPDRHCNESSFIHEEKQCHSAAESPASREEAELSNSSMYSLDSSVPSPSGSFSATNLTRKSPNRKKIPSHVHSSGSRDNRPNKQSDESARRQEMRPTFSASPAFSDMEDYEWPVQSATKDGTCKTSEARKTHRRSKASVPWPAKDIEDDTFPDCDSQVHSSEHSGPTSEEDTPVQQQMRLAPRSDRSRRSENRVNETQAGPDCVANEDLVTSTPNLVSPPRRFSRRDARERSSSRERGDHHEKQISMEAIKNEYHLPVQSLRRSPKKPTSSHDVGVSTVRISARNSRSRGMIWRTKPSLVQSFPSAKQRQKSSHVPTQEARKFSSSAEGPGAYRETNSVHMQSLRVTFPNPPQGGEERIGTEMSRHDKRGTSMRHEKEHFRDRDQDQDMSYPKAPDNGDLIDPEYVSTMLEGTISAALSSKYTRTDVLYSDHRMDLSNSKSQDAISRKSISSPRGHGRSTPTRSTPYGSPDREQEKQSRHIAQHCNLDLTKHFQAEEVSDKGGPAALLSRIKAAKKPRPGGGDKQVKGDDSFLKRIASPSARQHVLSESGRLGISPRNFHTLSGSEAGTTNNEPGPTSPKEDSVYAKYYKMLKVGTPVEAVRHAAIRDGLDPSFLDEGSAPDRTGVPLKDDPKYSKYFKMLKLGLPMGAIKNALQRDGIDPSIMDGDHDAPVTQQSKKRHGGPVRANSKPKDTFRRTRLHWEPLGNVSSNSVWALVGNDPDVRDLDIDEDEFEELFRAELGPLVPSTPRNKGAGDGTGAVKVIDSKRANNGGIILARLKISFAELARAIDKIDCETLTQEQLNGILEYIPTKEERRALASYFTNNGADAESQFQGLCECEKFMVTMMSVRHARRKILVMLFMHKFSSRVRELERDAGLVDKACDELFESARFRKVLGIVLNIGNKLNTAGTNQRCEADAIKLDSLLKLNQAKAFDKKTTCLHYVTLVVERNNQELTRFKEDLPHVFMAEKVFVEQSRQEVDTLWNELDNVRKVALLYAREKGKSPLSTSKRRGENDSVTLCSEALPEEEEVQLLKSTTVGQFTINAILKLSALLEFYEATQDKFGRLLEFFGEDKRRKDMQPHDLFHIVATFCRNFDSAHEEVIAEGRVKRGRERRTKSPQPVILDNPKPTNPKQSPAANASDESQTIVSRSSSKKISSMNSVLSDIRSRSRSKFRWRRRRSTTATAREF